MKWPEFRRRYLEELEANPAGVKALVAEIEATPVTLVFGSRELRRNSANVLQEYLETHG